MRRPTPEQQDALDSMARVRVVRAVPGSGKTWFVAELIRQELDKWLTRTSGIAALSFTRVGGEEIRKALDYELGHPHVVGTIDAFLFRYVVRPFLQRGFPTLAAPRLIPGEWGAEHWSNYRRDHKVADGPRINLFDCVFIDEVAGKAVVAHKPQYERRLRQLDDQASEEVKKAKWDMWVKSGRLTHSDVAVLASKILEHETLGAVVRAELVRRFPLIIVDELQDTSYFLGKCFLLLLAEPTARGVLVSDPDQAIFEFNGARPDLFNRFESIAGAVTLPLSSSRRCPISIATAASHLKDSGGSIGTANCNNGKAFLVRYSNLSIDILRIVDAVTKMPSPPIVKVIARQKHMVATLIGRGTKPAPKLGCQSLNHLHRAVIQFRQGRQVAALAAARAALELVIFEYEGVEDAELERHGIDPSRWKRLAVDCLLHASAEAISGNVYDWQTNVGKILDEELDKFGFAPPLQFTAGKLKPQRRGEDWDKACGDYLPQIGTPPEGLADVPVTTVHSVKGETHNVTIFVCPDTKANHCPSVMWWSDCEEKRIAYVAMTRTQGDLIICVSTACYRRLCEKQPEFVKSFECRTVEEYVSDKAC